MDSNLGYLSKVLGNATCLEDIFGYEPDANAVQDNYVALVALLGEATPGTSGGPDAAKTIREKLRTHYDKAQAALESGTYGEQRPLRKPVPITIGDTQYLIERQIATTAVTKVYRGKMHGDEGPIPIVMKRAIGEHEVLRTNNALLKDEAATLRAFWAMPDELNLQHLPKLIASFIHDGAQYNILEEISGLDFYRIRLSPRQCNGVSDLHLVWILHRTLSALGYAHDRGYVHANISPSHLIVTPKTHNVHLIDWCWAVQAGQKPKKAHPVYSPPEIHEDLPPTPSSDIYSLGKCMIFLSGGDPVNNTVPVSLATGFANLLKSMVLPSPLQRPRDAYQLRSYLTELRDRIHGPRSARDFEEFLI